MSPLDCPGVDSVKASPSKGLMFGCLFLYYIVETPFGEMNRVGVRD